MTSINPNPIDLASLTGPGPRERAYRNSNHILLDRAPAPKGGVSKLKPHPSCLDPGSHRRAYRNPSHTLLDWAPAPKRERIDAQAIASRPPQGGHIETQAISSSIGPRPPNGGGPIEAQAISSRLPDGGRVETQTISSLIGPRPTKKGVSKLRGLVTSIAPKFLNSQGLATSMVPNHIYIYIYICFFWFGDIHGPKLPGSVAYLLTPRGPRRTGPAPTSKYIFVDFSGS